MQRPNKKKMRLDFRVSFQRKTTSIYNHLLSNYFNIRLSYFFLFKIIIFIFKKLIWNEYMKYILI